MRFALQGSRQDILMHRTLLGFFLVWFFGFFFQLLRVPFSCPHAEPLYLAAGKKDTLFLLSVITCLTKTLITALQNTSNLCWFSTLMLLVEVLHKTSEWKRPRPKCCCMWLLFLSHLKIIGLTFPRIPPQASEKGR